MNVKSYRVSKLRQLPVVFAIQHISKHMPGEDRNLIKKGWDQLYMVHIEEEGFLTRAREARALCQATHNKAKETARVEALKDHLLVHNSSEGFDMDKDYTKDYPQEDAFRGFTRTSREYRGVLKYLS